MHDDLRPAPTVTVAVPAPGTGAQDVLRAGTDAPVRPGRGRSLLAGAAAAAVLALAVSQAGRPPGGVAAPDRAEPVSLALVTTTASAAPVRDHDGGFATLRVRVAMRNDSPSWITVQDAALGPYRATGDGLGALAPGGLTSVPLERLVVCGREAPAAAPRFLAVDVLATRGPSQVYLGLLEPAAVDPAAVVPDCMGSRAS